MDRLTSEPSSPSSPAPLVSLGWTSGEDVELEDELYLIPVPHLHCPRRSGRKQNRKRSTVPPTFLVDLTQPGEAEFLELGSGADPNVSPPRTPVRVGFGTSPLHKALKRTSPTTSQPQPPSCSPPAQPEMPGRISQGEGQPDPACQWSGQKGVNPEDSQGSCCSLTQLVLHSPARLSLKNSYLMSM